MDHPFSQRAGTAETSLSHSSEIGETIRLKVQNKEQNICSINKRSQITISETERLMVHHVKLPHPHHQHHHNHHRLSRRNPGIEVLSIHPVAPHPDRTLLEELPGPISRKRNKTPGQLFESHERISTIKQQLCINPAPLLLREPETGHREIPSARFDMGLRR